MTTVQVGSRRLIFREGTPADSLYNVTSGVVKIYKSTPDGRRQVTGFLFPGDFLGFVQRQSYAYSAVTLTKTELCRFKRSELEQLIEELPQLEHRFLTMMTQDMAAAYDQMFLLARRAPVERVVSFFLALSSGVQRRNRPGNIVPLPMPRPDVAQYLGLSLRSLNRALAVLSARGLIRFEGEKLVHLSDPAALFEIENDAHFLSETEDAGRKPAVCREPERLLAAMAENPGASIAMLAKKLNWTDTNGAPKKSKVHRLLDTLRQQDLCSKKERNWMLTRSGEKAAKEIAI